MTAHIETMWRLFRAAEADAIPASDEDRERYMFFCGAFAAFHMLARYGFAPKSVGEVRGEVGAFARSVFEVREESHDRYA